MKTKYQLVILTVMVIVCLLLSPAGTALAQDPIPPNGEKPGGSQGSYRQHQRGDRSTLRDEVTGLAVQAGRGQGEMTGPEIGAEADLGAEAGTDSFGYTKKAVAFDWLDISTNGTLLDLAANEVVGVTLPFAFKFYENTYTTLDVARYGYLTFSQHPEVNWQSTMPRPDEPNNVIAPYWVPVLMDGGAVYMEDGGTAPNRYIVFQWNNVSDEWTEGENRFTFQVILLENGNIVFQYAAMNYTWGYNFATAGIEDSTGGNGLVSLKYKSKQKSNKAVLFTRPTGNVALSIFPLDYGQFAAVGGSTQYHLFVKNTGEAGDDVYDIKIGSRWPAAAFQADGVTPLTDTDGDRKLDTGVVAPGDTAEIVVQITAPLKSKIGQSALSTVTFTSSLKTSRRKLVKLTTTIPAGFVQAYSQDYLNQDADVKGAVVDRNGVFPFDVANNSGGYSPAVTGIQTDAGNGFYTWSSYVCPDFQCERIFYSIRDASGGNVLAPTGLDTPPTGTWDFAPVPAGASNGNVGVTYLHQVQQGNSYIYNVYFVLFGSGGSIITGPVNVTNINAPGVELYNPRIVATQASEFIVAWEQYDGGNVSDIYMARYGTGGNLLSAPQAFTADAGDGGDYYGPSLIALKDGNLLLAYNGWKVKGRSWSEYTYYQVLTVDGTVVRPETSIALGQVDSAGLDSAQMSNGQVVLVWGAFKKDMEGLYYAVLKDMTYAKAKGPVPLTVKPAVTGSWYASVAADAEGRAIITFADDYQSFGKHLYYALLGKNGVLLTKPVIFMTPRENQYLYLNSDGYGNMPLPILP